MNKKNIFFILLCLCSVLIYGCRKQAETIIEFSDEDRIYDRLLKYYDISEVGPPKQVDDGILFTFAEDYQNVELSGDFINWEYTIPMIKGRNGIFYYLYQSPIKAGNYTYKYRVDGLWIVDPLQTNITYNNQDGALSFFTVDNDVHYYRSNPIYNDNNTVTFFYENAEASEVNFAINEYGFDSYRYEMKKGDDNIWCHEVLHDSLSLAAWQNCRPDGAGGQIGEAEYCGG